MQRMNLDYNTQILWLCKVCKMEIAIFCLEPNVTHVQDQTSHSARLKLQEKVPNLVRWFVKVLNSVRHVLRVPKENTVVSNSLQRKGSYAPLPRASSGCPGIPSSHNKRHRWRRGLSLSSPTCSEFPRDYCLCCRHSSSAPATPR